MPKLYHHEGRWQVPGQQDRKAARIDVPGSPEPLADWLNERDVSPDAGRLERSGEIVTIFPPQFADGEGEAGEPITEAARRQASSRCGKCNSLLLHTEKAAIASAHSSMLACFSEWIDDAPPWAIERLTEQLAERRQA